MDLTKIQEMFDKDSKIDETNINLEETRSPALLNKYLKLYTNFRLMLSKAETDMKILKKQKWEYYSGKSEKPFELKILRQDIPTYLESDEDMVRLQSKLDYLKVVSSYLEHIVKNLHNRGFQLRNITTWIKYTPVVENGVTITYARTQISQSFSTDLNENYSQTELIIEE